jgi:hypothetical protein
MGDVPTPRRRAALLEPTLLCLAALLVTGCAAARHDPAYPSGDGASTVARLGAVPVPTATGPPGPLPASPGHPQLLPIGGAVLARLPEGTATVTVLGPDVDLPPGSGRPIEDADATITVRTQETVGHIVPLPREFTARDDHGRDIALTAVPGAGHDAAVPPTAIVALTGHFHAGSAQVTWRHDDSVVGVWTFVIELD